MSNKKKSNGYFLFMQDERQRIQAETGQTPSMQEMAAICSGAWKNLSAGEKAKYNAMAKQGKGKNSQDRDRQRLDALGQNIMERQNAVKEAINRRIQEKQDLIRSWDGRDILDVPFHLINFQVMYEDSAEYYLPLEVGIVSFTFREGITDHFHCFIDPGDAPQGNLHDAMKHSENTHQIPLHFERADSDFFKIWTRIEKFVVGDPQRDEVPPLFCMLNERPIVESCLDYIHYYARSGKPNILTKIYTLEDLVLSIFMKSGKFDRKPSETQIQDSLMRNQWDYVSSLRCSYHDDLDCPHCSLAIVKRKSFLMFDLLSNVLDFKLTENHMPDETSSSTFTVMRPSNSIRDEREAGGQDTRHTRQLANTRSFNRSPSPPSSGASQYLASGRTFGALSLNQSQVSLSDSDDDGEYDDEANGTRSTSEKYVLEELRKPKTHGLMLPTTGLGYGRGLALAGSKATPPIAGQNQVRYASAVRPPPGFNLRPGVPPAPVAWPQRFPPATLSHEAPTTSIPQTVPGWGRGRGRGLPPQVWPVQQ